ncbi:exodeoxyribonuclease VII small subunit [Clostridium sp. Cult3]|uniref:exodeoxyribonuclease VII small subunit n=1 Tax=Clostridium sp. Cult3 TaxID=2079004 RepID=UPI001EFFCBEE|nr:exodeoxyribonuclease VII small subunit [Clostridium sp. Cult3]MCF6460099.1 exodeoxyribonuclease VII small subunit [Clostridium sp. Cult3]
MNDMDLTYEEAVKELEEILEAFEEDDIALKDSLEKFKKGVALYNYCNEILKSVEGEVKILLQDDEGAIEEEEFQMEV